MEFRVLGPLEVVEDGRRLAIVSGRQRALLALLVINANRVVPAERIVDELWGDEGPDSGVKAVAFHVSKLRDALEPGRRRNGPTAALATESAGYVLRADADQVDAARFERMAAEGRARLTDDPAAAASRLSEALALWRGEPYADVAFESFAQPEIRRLGELRLRTLEDQVEADLALGRHTETLGELEGLVAAHPLRERLRGQLMTALYRAGRQAEALRAFQDGRRLLSEELGIDPSPELRQLETWILRQDPRLDGPIQRRAVRNPYKGLRPFGEEDSADFFGQEALVARLVERLGMVARAGRFLAVVGSSGSGKSSAVRAGLVPALRAGVLPGSEHWLIAIMVPGARPFRELAAALRAVGAGASPGLDEQLALDGGLSGAIAAGCPSDVPVLLLVIDQFEELFTLVEDDSERARFIAELVRALSADDGRLLITATLRADFFDRPLLSAGLGELVRTGTEVVTPLDRDELERAVVRPAESVGAQLEPGLATDVIAEVAAQPGQLPLLQYALTELFERSDGRRLTRDGYAAIGGVLGALGRRADGVYATLDPDGREIARQAFLRLVAPGEAGEPIARRVPRSELRDLADERRVDEVLDEFGRRRLLSFDRDAVTGEPAVQVAHEALLARWPRLAAWIEKAREDLWTRRRLADAASDWVHAGRDQGFLLSGSRLELFSSWARATDLRLDAPQRELLDASLAERAGQDDANAARAAHERALERRATTRLRALTAVLAVAAIVASSLSLVVYGQGQAAREQAAIATARELAAGSIGNLGTDSRLSLLLAWQAADETSGRGYVVEEAMDALHWALQASHVPYPAGEAPVAVRSGPAGARGVMLLAPDRLMALAAAAAGRSLSAEECRTYLHRATCSAPVVPSGSTRTLDVYTASGVVPVGRLASGSLAGTRVDLVSQLPVEMGPLVASFKEQTGIDVAEATGAVADLEARVAAGNLPDVAIVSRPALVAELARAGLLVDLSGYVDVARLHSTAGDYLAGLGTMGNDGSWPAAAGHLYGAPFATEGESLVWYPRTAFERAGYTVPQTWDDLTKLADRMVADGRTPWCLGVAGSGGDALGFVEDLALHAAGPAVYDSWVSGIMPFGAPAVRSAFSEFGSLAFRDGFVLGGVASALRTPRDLAAWPMFLDAPDCWLHLGGASDRLAWPAGGSGTLAAFPFPATDPTYADEVRGRAYAVVVFHDRPEVRRFVGSLLGDELAAAMGATLSASGIVPLGSVGPAVVPPDDALQRALRAGTFRVAASDLMPTRVAAAFAQGMEHYLEDGLTSLDWVLAGIQGSWREAP
jgi:DNA-binding SARP family transcriptional activator